MKILQFRYRNGPFSSSPFKYTKRTVIVLNENVKSITGLEVKSDFTKSTVKSFSKNRITKRLCEVEMRLS